MPPNRKPESSDSDSSGPEDKNTPPLKKLKRDNSTVTKTSSEEPKTQWILEKNKLVNVNEFRGKKMIDIREHYEKDGKILPGKKGISLSILQWKKLIEYSEEISNSLEK